MGKPRLIILIRHAQSEGNKNREIHQTIPDHRVKLTQDGWQQAYEAGHRLRKMLRPDDKIHFFISPYLRTRQTTNGILATLTSDDPEPSPFKRDKIKVYEEPRLREQDFGNFQPCSAEMERMWQERADYGHFYYRIPNGESAADAYDRVSGFNESLWRQFGDDDFASVCVIVTHGLMSRVFLMRWYHFSVEYFEDLRNVNHCEFLIMRKDDESGKYILENKLRTWSELKEKRKKLLLAGEKGTTKDNVKVGTTTPMDAAMVVKTELQATEEVKKETDPQSSDPPIPRRKWGGCPNGCNHDKNFRVNKEMDDLRNTDHKLAALTVAETTKSTKAASVTSSGGDTERGSGSGDAGSSTTESVTSSVVSSIASSVVGSASVSSSDSSNSSRRTAIDTSGTNSAGFCGVQASPNPSFNGTGEANGPTLASRRPAAKRFQSADTLSPEAAYSGPVIDVTKARDEIVSSPDGTPSFISLDVRLRNHMKSPTEPPPPKPMQLHVGRDFGGTYSGHNSTVASDADSSEDERHRRIRGTLSPGGGLPPGMHLPGCSQRDQSRVRANRLGDHHSDHHTSDGEHEADVDSEIDETKSKNEKLKKGTLDPVKLEKRLEEEERVGKSVMGSVF